MTDSVRLFLLGIFFIAMAPWRWIRHWPPACKRDVLGILFFLLFLASDGSSAVSQAWEGAPPTYLPVGLAVAMLLAGGVRYAPLIFVSGIVAAVMNYHRALFGWCGIPGVSGLYLCYVAAAVLLRSRLRIDIRLRGLRDVGRYVLVLLAAETISACIGMLTLRGDGYITRSQAIVAFIDWWASDAIAILTVAPFLLIYVAPWVDDWLKSEPGHRMYRALGTLSRADWAEITAQAAAVVVAIWLIFGCTRATSYQPLYLLFIPVIWVAVRRGLQGAVLTVFAINAGLTSAAWFTHAPNGSLPRLQLAMLALGLTALCLGAVVSDGKRAQEQLRRSEAGLREAQHVARLGSWTLDAKTEEIVWSEELFKMHGRDPSLPPPRFPELSRIFAPESWQRLSTQVRETMRTGVPYELELETVRADGRPRWILARGQPRRNARGEITGLAGIAQDITERKRAEKRVQILAYCDALTGLPNRSLFQDRLDKAIAGARRRDEPLAVLFLDLDRFKSINDSLGHATGDLLLQAVAERLKKHTREQDTVARVGGDEFLILLSSLREINDAATAAERIVHALAEGFVIQGRTLRISCSLGISIFPEHGADCETLIRNADAAMYDAKESGRNQFRFFTDEMNAQVLERSALEQGLRMALDQAELFLMYQPQIDLRSGRVAGLEALVRWRSPEFGQVPPDRFIGVAENSGLIIPIGDWVLNAACAQFRQWQQLDLPAVSVAVNVSALQFRQEGFRERIRRVLQDSGIAPHCLELELTESVLTTNADVMFSILQDLKEMGLKLSIDDFGTGYSSLSYLRQFPVSRLKIDRSFIRDVATNSDAAVVATAIIGLAKSLNLKVIAEGVETEAQLAFLRAHDCDEAQGYYFSEPLQAQEAEDYLRRQRALVVAASGSL
jgi:diguanylate cyclase (GGDEF)-like protein/PAS domain S-box-containing protein